MATAKNVEMRDDVKLTNLDEPLYGGSTAKKRDLVDYLDAVSAQLIDALRNRPLSVIRVTQGQGPFMQKNVPKYTPDWVATVPVWAEASKRTVSYALCNDRRTLLWFANQRAVEYHPALSVVDQPEHNTHLVIDIDPPAPDAFGAAVGAAMAVHEALDQLGLQAAVKTSGSKGLHIFVPIEAGASLDDAAAATRAIALRAEQIDPATTTTAFMKADRQGKVFLDSTRAGGATVAAAYSPRMREGMTVSFPVAWSDLEQITPANFTIFNAAELLGDNDPWADAMPLPQALSAELVAEGHGIPIPRVAAMHEGKRRARSKAAEPAT